MFATVEDLAVRIPGGIPAADLARAEAYLEDASSLIEEETGRDFAGGVPSKVKRICLAAALRAWFNPDYRDDTTIADYRTRISVSGGVYLTDEEKRELAKFSSDSGLWVQPMVRRDRAPWEGADEVRVAASSSGTVGPDSVGRAQLQDKAVGSDQVDDDAIIARHVADGALPVDKISGLASVATSGEYSELANVPQLAAVAFSGEYADLEGLPTVAEADYTAPFAGAVQRALSAKLADVISVRDFGATGNGSTDDSAAIQAALDAAGANGEVLFPRGNYRCVSGLVVPDGCTLIGSGSEQNDQAGDVRLIFPSLTGTQPGLRNPTVSAGNALKKQGLEQYIGVQRMTLEGPSVSAGVAIYASNAKLTDVVIFKWSVGVHNNAGYYSSVLDSDISYCATGILLGSPPTLGSGGDLVVTSPYNVDIRGTRTRACTIGVQVGSISGATNAAVVGLTIAGCSIEGYASDGDGPATTGVLIAGNGSRVVVRDTYFETRRTGSRGLIHSTAFSGVDLLLEGCTIYADRTSEAVDVSAWAANPAANARCSLTALSNQFRGNLIGEPAGWVAYRLPTPARTTPENNHRIDIAQDSTGQLAGVYGYHTGPQQAPGRSITPPLVAAGRPITDAEFAVGRNLLHPNVGSGGDLLGSRAGFTLLTANLSYVYVASPNLAYRGSGCIRVVTTATGAHAVGLSRTSSTGGGAPLLVTPGTVYSFRGHVRTEVGKDVLASLRVTWRRADWSSISTSTVQQVWAVGAWSGAGGQATAPAESVYAQVDWLFSDTDSAQQFLIDTHYVTPGAVASDYLALAEAGVEIPSRLTVADTAVEIPLHVRYVAQTETMSAARVWTLPPASAVPGGAEMVVADESGTVTSTNKIVLTAAGSDVINGAATLDVAAAYGVARLVSDGVSKWTRV